MADQVTGNEGGPVTYTKALEMINRFKAGKPADTITAHLVGINKLNDLLNQPGVKGIRMYYAINDSGKPDIVIFAVDANGDGLQGYILDQTYACPPYCGKP